MKGDFYLPQDEQLQSEPQLPRCMTGQHVFLPDCYLLDSGVKEGHKQVEEPEQPHSPFMIADGIANGIYLIYGLWYRCVFLSEC